MSITKATQKLLGCLFNQRKEIYKESGLISIGQTEPEDVFVIGFPKSGNTWFKSIIAGLVHRVDPEFASDILVQYLVPDIDAEKYYARFTSPMFFKTHELPQPRFKRVVYLIRDGRDAMVSFYRAVPNMNFEQKSFLEFLRNPPWVNYRWDEHIEKWMQNPYRAEVLSVKYEDLLRNPKPQLIRLCDFLKIEREESHIESVIAKTTFEKMKLREAEMGWNPRYSWNNKEPFIRRGMLGSYRDEMPPEALELFMSQSGKTLERLGYV